MSSPREFFLLITLNEGTESRSAAILSLRFVRYRFSIMLCAVFLTGGHRSFVGSGLSSSSSSSSMLDFLLRFPVGSGDDGEDDGDVGYCACVEGMAILRSLDSSWGVSLPLYCCACLVPDVGRVQERGVE